MSTPGFCSFTWHEHDPIKNCAASSIVSARMPLPTSAYSARPCPKIGNAIGSVKPRRSSSLASSIATNAASAGSSRFTFTIENASRKPSPGTDTRPFLMSWSSSFGRFITPPRYSSRSSSVFTAAASFSASPLAKNTHTALSPFASRSAICFRVGESTSTPTFASENGADQITASFRADFGCRSSIFGSAPVVTT